MFDKHTLMAQDGISLTEQGVPVKSVAVPDQDLKRRAFAAWSRSGGTDQPTEPDHLQDEEGHAYVVLHNVGGILAVYRVKNDGALRALRRYPKSLIDFYA